LNRAVHEFGGRWAVVSDEGTDACACMRVHVCARALNC
jgi:hypothetical protein